MSACPDPSLFEPLLAGRVDETQQAELEAHLDGCPDCAGTFAELARIYGSAAWTHDSAVRPRSELAIADTIYQRSLEDVETPASLGRYQLGRKLGAGGMGMVFEAHDPELHRRVAIKLLYPAASASDSTGDADATRERLMAEARAMARLAHPNVVAVYDVGRVGKQLFIAMELVEGTTLRHWLVGRSRQQILAMFIQAGRGLEAAHRVGLVHRDFKPDNVLIGTDDRARVTDFGLARGAGPMLPSGMFETHGALIGTPAYMAPEQWRGAPADARTDQFAFCVALYEALFDARPFAGDTTEQLASNVLAGRVRPPTGASPWLRNTVLRGLEQRAERRHPSMDALLGELARDRGKWRRVVAVGGAMVIGAAATVGVLRWATQSAQHPSVAPQESAGAQPVACTDMRTRTIDRYWSDARRSALRNRLRKMDNGEQLAKRALPVLNAWVEEHGAATSGLCRDGETPYRAARQRCLDHGAQRFEAVVEFMIQREQRFTERALTAIYRLPEPKACKHWEGVGPEAPSNDLNLKVKALQGDLAAAHASFHFDRFVQAPNEVKHVLDRAGTIGYAPLVAEAELVFGQTMAARYEAERAVTWLERAALDAGEARDDRVQAEAALGLIIEHGARRLRPADANSWIRMAEKSAPRDEHFAAQLDNAIGKVQHAAHNYSAARQHFEKALEALRTHHDGDHVEIAETQLDLSAVLVALGDTKAEALARQARDMLARLVGPEDLRLALAEAALGRTEMLAGKFVEAEASARRAVEIPFPGASLRHDLDRGTFYDLVARALVARGESDEALAIYDKSLLYRFKEPQRAIPMLLRGALLAELGKAEGLDEMRQAVAWAEKSYEADDPRLISLLRVLGRSEAAAEHFDAGRAALERAVELTSKHLGSGGMYGEVKTELGKLERAAGRNETALGHLDDAYVPLYGPYPAAHALLTDNVLTRADIAWDSGQHDYAGRLYRSVEPRVAELMGADHADTKRCAQRKSP